MGYYTDIKARVQEVIRPNGVGAITASDHQKLLLDFVDKVESNDNDLRKNVAIDREKLTELESDTLTKDEFNGVLNKIEITKADVLRIPYVLFPNRNYKIVNNIGVLTKFNVIKEDGSEIIIAQIPNGQSATFRVPSKCVYFQFYAAVQGGNFEVGEDVNYRGKILNSENEIYESRFDMLKQSIIGEKTVQTPTLVFKHINASGDLQDNENRNIVFENAIYAAKGSFFYAKTGYKLQYALYDKTTGDFIKRVTWIPENQIVQLDADYYIRIELSDAVESVLTDTSISENLQMELYIEAESIDATINNLITRNIDISRYSKRLGSIVYGKWYLSEGYGHIVIPVYPNQLYRIETGDVRGGYCFVKDYSSPIEGETPNFATGYSENIDIASNTKLDVIAPIDAYYMVVLAETYFANRLPIAISSYGEIDAKIDPIKEDTFINAESAIEVANQINNVVNCIGIEQFINKSISVSRADKYRCWPFIGQVANKAICVYVEALEHEDADKGAIYATSSDNGIVWRPRKKIIDTPNRRDGITGKGSDQNGAFLIFNRVGYPSSIESYEVYRSENGETFEKISTIDSFTSGHIGDIVNVPNVGLMAFYHTYNRTWGKFTSEDNGVTWKKTEIEVGLTASSCPAEISAIYVGNGKILAIGRCEDGENGAVSWQLQSSDYGVTWERLASNIVGVSNTCSLLYDENTETITLFRYNRATGELEKRVNQLSEVWDNPQNWSEPTIIAYGNKGQDAGNVNATKFNGNMIAAYYTGNSIDTGIYAITTK